MSDTLPTATQTASHTRPTARVYYRPELDALRLFAFLCVFAFHRIDYVPTDPLRRPLVFHFATACAFGVPVFFLLSAFLITELLVRERERTGRIHIPAFYMRRILRIWPLYFAVFLALGLINRFHPGYSTADPRAWLAFTFFSGNWYITLHGWIANPVDPFWSISVEEQFYLVIPVLAALGGRRILAAACALVIAGSYLTVFLYALHHPHTDAGEWTNSFTHFQFFAAGTLLALLLRGRLVSLALPLRLAGFVLGFVCWLTATVVFHVQSWNPQPTPPGAVAGWGLVLAGAVLFFLSALGTPARFIPAPVAYLGRISFGLYMFHAFFFTAIFYGIAPSLARWLPGLTHHPASLTAAALALTVTLAHLSFRYFERPFLRLKDRFTFIPSREELNPQP